MVQQRGTMRKRIQIQQRTTAQDTSFGQQLIGWTTIATVWAEITSLSGSQLERARSIYNETSHAIYVRWKPLLNDIKTVGSYRILYGSRVFDVGASLNLDERNVDVTLFCKEGLNDGQ